MPCHRLPSAFSAALLCALAATFSSAARAEFASATGQTGLINMPDGRIAPDGTLRFGLSNLPPYRTGWGSIAFLPWLEVTGRYTRLNGVPSFGAGTEQTQTYGDYKDKTFDGKLRLWPEGEVAPGFAIGVQDVFGTGLFRAYYAAATKRVGPIDLTVGYGAKRIDGLFAGARWKLPGTERFALVAEYDAYDYARDRGSDITGVDQRKHGVNAALEYHGDGFTIQAGRQNGVFAWHAYVNIPLGKREFIPKTEEPEPYTKVTARPTAEQWRADPRHVSSMLRELGRDDFRGLQIKYADYVLDAQLTNVRVSTPSRAIGRAARILLALGPIETREIRITYLAGGMPLSTYTFVDVETLQAYFNGLIDREALAKTVRIEFAEPAAPDMSADSRREEVVAALAEARSELKRYDNDAVDRMSIRSDDNNLNRFWLGPNVSTFLNDPSGAFRYEVSAIAAASRKLADRTYLNAAGVATILEDVTQVTQPSNSALPHVRSDIAEYKRGSRVKLAQLVVNRFDHPAPRIYTRLSGGLYEQMFGGVGGQVLFLPKRGPWAADFAIDALKQRDFEGFLGFQRYQTVTAIASIHYRLPMGMTATLRAGRFLAQDEGARFELKRRFNSGVTIGAWYTKTNGNDITSPGSPSNPYSDKGVFVSFPFGAFEKRDSAVFGSYSLSPWTRDVGQMVGSPGDLWGMMEHPLTRGMLEKDGLDRFGDVDDDYPMREPRTLLDSNPYSVVWRDAKQLTTAPATAGFWRGVGLGAVLVAAAMPADRFIDRQAKKYADSKVVKAGADVASAIPLALFAGSAALAVYTDDDRVANTAYTALRSGVYTLVANQGVRFAVGRARPIDNRGSTNFDGFSRDALRSGFTSNHVSTAFAFATPFAEEYDMPWLYALAGLTSLGRIAKREHWASDTIGGAILGFGIGHAMWRWNRDPKKNGPQVAFTGREIQAQWTF